jgi:ubiquinone/menaquinone biosynthesis C-methylase UbiE
MSDAAQEFYTRWAGLYDAVARYTPGVPGMRTRVADALDLDLGDTVVEMGCGTGANLGYLRERVGPEGTVVGVDFSPGALDRAAEHVTSEGWENVHLVRGDATRPPIADVDAVLGTFVVGMFADPDEVVERWCDLVGPGGRIALLNAARSRRPYGPLVNLPFRGLVRVSTPGKRGHGTPPHVLLDRRIEAGHAALERRCERTVHEERLLGLLRLAAGRVS